MRHDEADGTRAATRRWRGATLLGALLGAVSLSACGASAPPPSDTVPRDASTTPGDTSASGTDAVGDDGRYVNADRGFSLDVDPAWVPVTGDLDPPEGAAWFTNLASGENPDETTDEVIVAPEPLIGTSLAEDITTSIREQGMRLRSRRVITLADGVDAERIDVRQGETRIVAVIALDGSGRFTISAAFAGIDDDGYRRDLRRVEPYLRSLRVS